MTEQRLSNAIDLESYFRRIGYAGSREPDLDTLRGILERHTASIAFENLSPLIGQPVRLDPASLQHKLVESGRGGYCFEHNLLLRGVLLALGFTVTGLAARVRWNVPAERVTARGHMLLLVDLAGQPYIVDAGFGGLTLTAPLALAPDIAQPTTHEPFRLLADGAGYMLQACIGADWKDVYRFDLQAQQPIDYEAANWYLSTHPDSHFVSSLMAARPAPGRRVALRDNQLSIHHLDGASERRELASAAELRATLADLFGLTLPDTPDLDRALERIIEKDKG
jgi:N-hydroxyarylamine O-acetyltransferase